MKEQQTITIPEFLTQHYYEKTRKRKRVFRRATQFLKMGTITLLVLFMIFSLVACGGTGPDTTSTEEKTESSSTTEETEGTEGQTEVETTEGDTSSSMDILDKITKDFEDTTTNLREKQQETYDKVGTSYQDYQANKGLIDEWIEFVHTETDALFARTRENSIAYFKQIASDPLHKYSEFCEEELDEYYDVVYDEAMEIYYDQIYDDAMEDLYDTYYDGIVDDAFDEIDYMEWSDASARCYQIWSDACTAIYQKWSDECGYLYGLWSKIDSAFCWDDNFDVDAIVAECEK